MKSYQNEGDGNEPLLSGTVLARKKAESLTGGPTKTNCHQGHVALPRSAAALPWDPQTASLTSMSLWSSTERPLCFTSMDFMQACRAPGLQAPLCRITSRSCSLFWNRTYEQLPVSLKFCPSKVTMCRVELPIHTPRRGNAKEGCDITQTLTHVKRQCYQVIRRKVELQVGRALWNPIV